MLLGPFLGMPVPLRPGQILWINMVTHGLPGVAFGGEPVDPARMGRPSPSPAGVGAGQRLLRQILVAGRVVSRGHPWSPDSWPPTRAAADLRSSSPWVSRSWAWPRPARAPPPRRGLARAGPGGCGSRAAVLQVLAVAWEPLRDLLGTQTISGSDALVIFCLAAIPGVVLAAGRLLSRAARSDSRQETSLVPAVRPKDSEPPRPRGAR